MSERCPGSVRCNVEDLQEALSIHTRKITDSCRDKDCIEDLRVFLTRNSQNTLDTCAGAKVRCAELLYTYIDVEPAAFDGHHYCVDATFYYRILADAVIGTGRPVTLHGVAVFSKRAVLCGEYSKAHIYTSDTRLGRPDGLTRISANYPTAVVEVTDTNSQNRKTNPYPKVYPIKQWRRFDASNSHFCDEKATGKPVAFKDMNRLHSGPHIACVTTAILSGPDADISFVVLACSALIGHIRTMIEIIFNKHR